MKKIVIIIMFLLLLSGCRKINKISDTIEINLDNCKIVSDKDTHGGFLGDGDYFAKISCDNVDLTDNWKELPLSESINTILRVKQCNGDGCKDVYERYNIPNITNGYYIFIDRHDESNNKYDDSELNNRSSYNFTLAILDKETNTIYYYELDT